MRAIVCRSFGPPSGLRVDPDWAEPDPGPGEVVVAVEAASVSFVDGILVAGRYQFAPDLPFVPGSEVVGTVCATGPGVAAPTCGARVAGLLITGGQADRVLVSARDTVPVPGQLDAGLATSALQGYSTALFALTRRDHLAAGEKVLVLGAGGGVGLAAVDVATSLGAEVIAAASSAAKRAAATRAGAAATVDTGTEDLKRRVRELSGGGVDVVVDPVGGARSEPALRTLGFGGRYHVVGFAGGAIPSVPLNLVLLNGRSMLGIEWGGWIRRHPGAAAEIATEVIDGIATGRWHPEPPEKIGLHEIPSALQRLADREVVGKIVAVL